MNPGIASKRRKTDRRQTDRPTAIEPLESRHLLSLALGVTAVDVAWIRRADSGDSLEIALGNIAQTNAAGTDIKSGGATMVTDHTATRATLEQTAASLGVTVTGALLPADQAKVNAFSRLSGTRFDQAYSSFMILDHKIELADYTRQADRTAVPALRTVATDQIPVLQSHLTLWEDSLVSRSDIAFVQRADSGNATEIALGNLAQTRASNQQIKSAGATMVTDHTAAQAALAQTAAAIGAVTTGTPNAADQRTITRLSALSGQRFDEALSAQMIASHRFDIALYTRMDQITTNTTLKAYVATQLPVLQSHLALWQGVALTPRDVAWVQQAASSNMLEIQLGTLAQTSASDAQVMITGERMVTDHTAAGMTLAQDAATLGITLSNTLDRRDQAILNIFAHRTGAAFDRSYAAFMVADHKQEIANFTLENKVTTNSIISSFTSDNIPVLQTHLSLWETTLAGLA